MLAWAGDLPSARSAAREGAALLSRVDSPYGPALLMPADAGISAAIDQYAEEEWLLRRSIALARSSGLQWALTHDESWHLLLVEALVMQDRLLEAEVEVRDLVAIAVKKTGRYSPRYVEPQIKKHLPASAPGDVNTASRARADHVTPHEPRGLDQLTAHRPSLCPARG